MRPFILVLALTVTAVPAFAQSATTGLLHLVRTGWNADSFALVLAQPTILNPANCPVPDGYLTDKAQPGYQTYYQAALAAYQINRAVTVTVDNAKCDFGRPRLIGINLLRN